MATKAIARPIIVQMPRRAPGRLRRAGRRVAHLARRARHSRHAPSVSTVAIILGGVAAGWAQQKGYLSKLPQLGGSTAITLTATGYVVSKYVKNRAVKAGGYALMAAGAFAFGKEQAGGAHGLDEHDEFGESAV